MNIIDINNRGPNYEIYRALVNDILPQIKNISDLPILFQFTDTLFLKRFNIDQIFLRSTIDNTPTYQRFIIICMLRLKNSILIKEILNKYPQIDLNMAEYSDISNTRDPTFNLNIIYISIFTNQLELTKYLFKLGAHFPRYTLFLAIDKYERKIISGNFLYFIINKCPKDILNIVLRTIKPHQTAYEFAPEDVKAYLRYRFKTLLDTGNHSNTIRERFRNQIDSGPRARTKDEIYNDETIIRQRIKHPALSIFYDNAGQLY